MAAEYRLSYTASEIDEKLGKVDKLDNEKVNVENSEITNSVSMGRTEGSDVGKNSVALGENVQAISDDTQAFGKDTITGCKAYYIKSIDTTNKKIYLSKTKVATPMFSTDDNTDTTFETPAYAVGEGISIINYFHYVHCSTIESISHNVITYTWDLGFTEFVADDGIDGHTLYVATKPTIGIVDIGGYSFAEGQNNKAVGRRSHAEGRNNIAAGGFSHVEGSGTFAGYVAHAEGGWCEATGAYSHAEGGNTRANGFASHAEGENTQAIGNHSHAEGYSTQATNHYAHAEGLGTQANGEVSHAEGNSSKAIGHVSHAEGYLTKATNYYTHAEGRSTEANGECSHAEGYLTIANGAYSHVEGYRSNTDANATFSHAEGTGTYTSANNQHAQGKWNVKDTELKYAHIVGNGTSDEARSNAHTVDWNGNAWYKGSVTTNGADYAEYFEWADSNPNNEDRVGLLVTLDGEKIRLASVGDEILGIISGTAAVLGDNYECEWNGKYLTDDFGRVIYDIVEEFVEIPHTEVDDEGNIIERIENVSCGFFKHPRLNPDYDPEQTYVNRADRPEWDTVGMLGKLYVRDDGTATVNGYITVGENGIATASSDKTNMRVLSRVNENVVRVLLK